MYKCPICGDDWRFKRHKTSTVEYDNKGRKCNEYEIEYSYYMKCKNCGYTAVGYKFDVEYQKEMEQRNV